MAEYIKREAAINRIKNYASDVYGINLDDAKQFSGDSLSENYCEGLYEATELIADIPTVDAVAVTRCKDCKHRGWVQEPCHGKSVDYCKVWDCTLRNLESTFCSYGERKDG